MFNTIEYFSTTLFSPFRAHFRGARNTLVKSTELNLCRAVNIEKLHRYLTESVLQSILTKMR